MKELSLRLILQHLIIQNEIKKAVISTYGDKIRIFKESIPRAVTIAETASEGISIFAYDGGGKGAQSYQKLVEGGAGSCVNQKRKYI